MSFWRPIVCTDEQIIAFWAWFAENEEKLTERDGAKRAEILREAREHMQVLFPSYSKAVSMTVIPSGDRWEVIVSHGGRSRIKRQACRIRVLMPAVLQGKWRMEVSE